MERRSKSNDDLNFQNAMSPQIPRRVLLNAWLSHVRSEAGSTLGFIVPVAALGRTQGYRSSVCVCAFVFWISVRTCQMPTCRNCVVIWGLDLNTTRTLKQLLSGMKAARLGFALESGVPASLTPEPFLTSSHV